MRLCLFFLTAFFIGAPLAAQTDQPAGTVMLASGERVAPQQLDQAIAAAASKAEVSGVSFALVNENTILHSGTYGLADRARMLPVTQQTLFEFASMSKPVFGALVVDLAAEGVLELDAPLADYYPHPDLLDDPRAAQFTARQVLTHVTGLPNWRSDNPDGLLDIAFAPGTQRRYSGEGYEYLADVLMHILATDDCGLDGVFVERLARPAQANDTRFVQNAARLERKALGYRKGTRFSGATDYANDGFGAAYSIHSTPTDYARLMIGLMAGPSLDANERSVFLAPQDARIAADDPERALGLSGQALGYAIYDLPVGRVFAHGGNNEGFTGMSAMQPEKGWAFVLVANEDQANEFILEIAAIFLGLGSLTP